MAHSGEQVFVFLHLIAVFWLWRAELEINDDPFLPVCHHTVWASLHDFTVLNSQDGTLVEKCPTG